ncbi:Hydantoinase/oxoprolinase N-terminal region [Nakamurella panacisegetis]|uniref:Hydantoinase/oxoprolinase N-terminal region n=1 Tax=Nakamurella panacisegetis TaxID=1090615 RepID=A0A1H0S947_9ACTN|nr:hypothetical protein [Nakamurella panacisegetis]SDP37738.1 Hydantoinase/oxoprolinase N-terminal region [Nakamurella panacisegetis]
MPSRAGGPAYAGISLQLGRSHAVVLRDEQVVSVGSVPDGPGDAPELVGRIVEVAGVALEAVTIDLSQVLLDAVLHGDMELPHVAVVRIVPVPATDPALASSPARLVEQLIAHRFSVAGGHDLLGHELCPLDRAGLALIAARLAEVGLRDVAIVGAGSQASPLHEREAANVIQAMVPQARISVASDFGGQGLVAREATAALDCALGPLTELLLSRWEKVLSRCAPGVPLRVARGDGGYSTSSRVRALPVVALGASDAIQVAGAAHLAGRTDCRVLLPRPSGQVAGDVRNGLVAIRSGQLAGFGVELVVPTAVLTPDPGDASQDGLGRLTDVPVIRAGRDPVELACVGAAVGRPSSWLDEFAFIESADELDRVREEAQERANAIVVANGAAPGTACVAEVSTVAVPYSPPGTVRIRVRVTGAPDTDPRRVEVYDRMAP